MANTAPNPQQFNKVKVYFLFLKTSCRSWSAVIYVSAIWTAFILKLHLYHTDSLHRIQRDTEEFSKDSNVTLSHILFTRTIFMALGNCEKSGKYSLCMLKKERRNGCK